MRVLPGLRDQLRDPGVPVVPLVDSTKPGDRLPRMALRTLHHHHGLVGLTLKVKNYTKMRYLIGEINL